MKNILFVLLFLPIISTGQASIKEELKSLKTYPFYAPNPIPILSKNAKIYPYHTFDGYSSDATQKEWKVVTLENEFIKVFVLPEIGGKVWGAIDKVNGEEFIYRNEVIKFRNISMRGPWTSGGIEFNFGIIGHHPSTATPVDYTINSHEDGSVSCTVGNIDLPSHTQWRVTIRLPKDKSYFETNVNWYNPSPLHQSYYNWMTAAAFAQDDLVFHTPGGQYLEHSGEAKPWPVDHKNRNINEYRENNFEGSKSYHVVGEYNDFFGGYFENEHYGFGHWSEYEEIPGQKLWIWALSRSGGIWEDLLTDTDGQYIEFQAGREFLQYSPGEHNNPMTQAVFAPLSQDTWRELWFPVRDIDGLTDVSEKGVMHISYGDGKLKLGVNVFEKATGTILIKADGQLVVKQELSLEVPQTFEQEYPLPDHSDFQIEINELDLVYNSNSDEKKIKRPFESNELLDLESHEKNYYLGWEAYKFREYEKAEQYLKKCLRENPLHQEARSALAEVYYRNHEIDKSLAQTDTLLRINTRHGHGNYVAGLSYRSKKDFINALESLGWAARSIEFRSAAYTQMAELYLSNKQYTQAIKYADKALVFNAQNISAWTVRALSNRIVGHIDHAKEDLKNILLVDPLNHFARFESYLADPTAKNLELTMASHRSELAYQTILELAITYATLGRPKDAFSLLNNFEEDHPIVLLWKAHLDKENADTYLQRLDELSPEFVFPYRVETLEVLNALSQVDSSWKVHYYKALNLWAVNQTEKAIDIFKDLGENPDNAYFYSGRKEIMEGLDEYEPLVDLNKALELDKSALNYHNLSLHAYQTKRYDLAKTTAEEGMQKFPDDYMIGIDAAKAMLHTNDYTKARSILENINLLPYEGAFEGRTIYELLHTASAIKNFDLENFKGAIHDLKKAIEWPENLGVGKPFEPNELLQNYLFAKIYEKMDNNNIFKKHEQLVIDYFNQEKDFDDPKIALVLDVIKSSGLNKKLEAEILKSVTDETILNLIDSTPIGEKDKSILISQIEKALSLQ